jgi:hypothetical protein
LALSPWDRPSTLNTLMELHLANLVTVQATLDRIDANRRLLNSPFGLSRGVDSNDAGVWHPATSRVRFFDPTFCASSTLPEFLSAAMDAVRATVGADMATLQLLEGDALKIVEQRGFRRPFMKFFHEVRRDDQSSCGVALRQVRPIIVDDVETSPIFAESKALTVLQDAAVVAVQSVPLVASSGRLLGMLSAHYKAPTNGPASLALLNLVARRTAQWTHWKTGR